MPRRILPALAAAVLALGAAACGHGGDGPVTTPPPALGSDASDGGGSDPDPSDGGGAETEEPTAAAPDIPAPDPADYPGMDEETPEGAEQAARYFVATMFWGFQSGDTEEFETLYSSTCGVCQDNADAINKLASAGEFWSETSLEDADISIDPSSSEYSTVIGYSVVTSPHSEPDLSSGARTEVPEMQFSFGVGLNWHNDQWTVDGLALDIEVV